MRPVDVWAAGKRGGWVKGTCALGTLGRMQAQSSRLGEKESRHSADDISASHNHSHGLKTNVFS